MRGFEILIGPYAVAHLRLTQALESNEVDLKDRLKIYLADTLYSPNLDLPSQLTLTYKVLSEEHKAARKVKSEGDILVCLGNPPYDRQQIEEGDQTIQRKGGWVRYGDQIEGGARPEMQGERPILKDFTEPAEKAGAGRHVKNLYNDYVYFWRWALWRLFEQQQCGGIVSFITASSYLEGPGFIGMREAMRRTFDDLWIINLGGDNLGTRKTPNVFNIQTPVAVAIGIRGAKARSNIAATVHYTRIEAESREAKLEWLDGIENFAGLKWHDCPRDWHAPFLPAGTGEFFEWPKLTDIFPYQRSGSKFGRSWPIAETEDLIRVRWQDLLSKTGKDRERYFKNNQYRKIQNQYTDHFTGKSLPTILSLKSSAPCPKISRYAFRSFDRQWAIEDIRFNDRMGEVLWRLQGETQLYLASLASESLGRGQGMIVSSAVPDLHIFRGSFGGKDVMPLYRDRVGKEPNITHGLLETLGLQYGKTPTSEDLAAYIYALLGGQSYTQRFWNELEKPGPRVPITKDGAIFFDVAALGRQLIWFHTYAERFRDNDRGDMVPSGMARCVAPVPDDPACYPEQFVWIETERAIRVGEGRFSPVSPEVWNFEVSGLKVVHSWLDYRMKRRAGKKSSPLDNIRPERWTPRMTEELLELLWVLEATLAMEPELKDALDRATAGPCFKASELPQPAPDQCEAPTVVSAAGELLQIVDNDDD